MLKIDRTDATKLEIVDDGVEYSARQIEACLVKLFTTNSSVSYSFVFSNNRFQEVLVMIAASAGTKAPLVKKSAFGILGFVRFLQGW